MHSDRHNKARERLILGLDNLFELAAERGLHPAEATAIAASHAVGLIASNMGVAVALQLLEGMAKQVETLDRSVKIASDHGAEHVQRTGER